MWRFPCEAQVKAACDLHFVQIYTLPEERPLLIPGAFCFTSWAAEHQAWLGNKKSRELAALGVSPKKYACYSAIWEIKNTIYCRTAVSQAAKYADSFQKSTLVSWLKQQNESF